MGHSSLVGTDPAPQRPKGTDEQSLGPSDLSDSGSDSVGRLPTADPGEPVDVTLNRDQAVAPIEGSVESADDAADAAADIDTDRVIDSPDGGEAQLDADDELPTTGRERRTAGR